MLGQKYFERRLSDIYKYSRIAYKCGKGTTNHKEYFWELCVDACGNIIFVLSSSNSLQNLDNTSNIEYFSGVSNDDIWDLNCTDIRILSTEVEVSKKLIIFSLPSSIILKRKNWSLKSVTFTSAKAYFSNFDFSRVDCERGFSAHVDGKKVCFQTLKTRKDLIKLIDIGRIQNSLLSSVSIPVDKNESPSAIEEDARSISWFLSLLNLNLTCIPIIEYHSFDREILQYSVNNTVKYPFCRSYIIDNSDIEEGIPKAFESCYKNRVNASKMV